MRITLGADETVETDEWSIVQLEALLQQLVEQCDRIAEQRLSARQKLVTTGEHSDPDWFRRLTIAGKKANAARMNVIHEISVRHKKERAVEAIQEQVPRHFLRVAKERLPPEIFTICLEEATRRFNDSQKGMPPANYVFEVGE